MSGLTVIFDGRIDFDGLYGNNSPNIFPLIIRSSYNSPFVLFCFYEHISPYNRTSLKPMIITNLQRS
jgi:hypothetical protein